MSMGKEKAELDAKIKTLNFRVKKTDEVLQKDDRAALERHRASLESVVTAVTTLKESIEEQMFAEGKDDQAVQEWADEFEESVDTGDKCMRQLASKIEQINWKSKHEAVIFEHKQAVTLENEKIEQQREAKERAYAEELAFEQKKLDLQQAQKKPTETARATSDVVKMPKLVITKFDGTPQDWMRFWGQFETQIDKLSAPAVTKISYLKELLVLKVRNLIDGLSFTPEGYQKAKDLLEQRYGKTSEVVGTYVRNILELPTIKERDVRKIHKFYEILLFNVESLRTLESLNKLDAAVRFTFDKLGVIKNELAMIDEQWSEWSFTQFLEVLEIWTLNNPLSEAPRSKNMGGYQKREKSRLFYSQHGDHDAKTSRGCLFCESPVHNAINCHKVLNLVERKKIFLEKRLCFNCTGSKHRAEDCKSKSTCQNCNARHHTSLCDKSKTCKPGMTANSVGNTSVIQPVVVVKIGGFKFRALLGSGASHSYASSTAIELIKVRPKSTGLRHIAMLTGITTRTMQVFDVVISSISGDFKLGVDITKVNKRELLVLENPCYEQIIEANPHLKGVQMDDDDTKKMLPIHMILGANDFAKIHTGEQLRVGRRGDPVAEFTQFGWIIMSPGADSGLSPALLAANSYADYEKLCALDWRTLQLEIRMLFMTASRNS